GRDTRIGFAIETFQRMIRFFQSSDQDADALRPKFPPLLGLLLVPVVLDALNPLALGSPVKERVARRKQQPGQPAEGNEQSDQLIASFAFHRDRLFWSLLPGDSLGFGAWNLELRNI